MRSEVLQLEIKLQMPIFGAVYYGGCHTNGESGRGGTYLSRLVCALEPEVGGG